MKTPLPDPRCESRQRYAKLLRCRLALRHRGLHAFGRRRWSDAEAETVHKKRLPRHDGLCRACGAEPRSPTTNNGLGAACLREHRKRYYKCNREPDKLVYRRWTEAELDRLRAEWGKRPPRDLVALFGRSYEALRCRAHILGLKTGRKGAYPHKHGNDFGCTCATGRANHWTASEVATLEVRYSRGDSVASIARSLRRSYWSVREKARKLGMRRESEEDVAA